VPVSTRVREASLIARLIGLLETERAETVYAHVGTSQRCPIRTSTQQPKCTVSSSFTAPLLHQNCSYRTTSRNFSSPTTDAADSLFSVTMATNDAVSQLTSESETWTNLSLKSRNFLRFFRPLDEAVVVSASTYAVFGNYSVVVDELMLLLPASLSDFTLPRPSLCFDCGTAMFASVSDFQAIAGAQGAVGNQCLLGHVFYACGGHLPAEERFYFRSNWSLAESALRDVRYLRSESATDSTIECSRRVFSTMSSSIEQLQGCTSDDVMRWYSACQEMLNATNELEPRRVCAERCSLLTVRVGD